MKDARFAIHSAFYSMLSGNVSINGDAVPVIDEGGDDDAGYPQVMFGSWTEVDDSDKTSFGSEYTFVTKIWDQTDQPEYSRAGIYDIIGQIKGIIRVRPPNKATPFNLQEFNVISCIVESTNTLPKSQTDTHLVWGEMIRWRLKVEEL